MLAQSHVRFNKVPEKVHEGSGEGFVKVGDLGAEPHQDQGGSGETFAEAFREGLEKVAEKVWEALVQSHVKITRVLEVSGEGLGNFSV